MPLHVLYCLQNMLAEWPSSLWNLLFDMKQPLLEYLFMEMSYSAASLDGAQNIVIHHRANFLKGNIYESTDPVLF